MTLQACLSVHLISLITLISSQFFIVDDSSEEGKKKKKKAKKLLKSDKGVSSQTQSSRGSGKGSGSKSAAAMIVDLADDSDQSTSCSLAKKSTHSKDSVPVGTKSKIAVSKDIKKSSKAPSSFFLSKVRRCHITSHHITSYHITSHHITSHHITSHHITLSFLPLIHYSTAKSPSNLRDPLSSSRNIFPTSGGANVSSRKRGRVRKAREDLRKRKKNTIILPTGVP